MSELRHDPLTDRWVVIAPEQAPFADAFADRAPASPSAPAPCPFCPGHESLTGAEIHAERPTDSARDTPGWRVRVVPNRVPALRVEGELLREPEGFFDRVSGVGAHEVVILSPRHDATLGTLSEAEVLEVLKTWQLRLRDLAGDQRLRSVALLATHGRPAGAHLPHPHAQLLALPFVPPALQAELARSHDHYTRHQRCLTCDLLRHERSSGVRLVGENGAAVALAAYAGRTPFESWVVPRQHSSHWEHESVEVLRGVAAALRALLQRLEVALPGVAWQLSLMNGPLRETALSHAHWRLELMPITQPTGALPLSSGVWVNPVAPETAAAFLREAGRPGGP